MKILETFLNFFIKIIKQFINLISIVFGFASGFLFLGAIFMAMAYSSDFSQMEEAEQAKMTYGKYVGESIRNILGVDCRSKEKALTLDPPNENEYYDKIDESEFYGEKNDN